MEWFLIILSGVALSVLYDYFHSDKKHKSTTTKETFSFNDTSSKNLDIYTNDDIIEKKKNNTSTQNVIINNYYTQNTLNVQVNHFSHKSKKSPHRDHTEKVWNEIGYRVKDGETYSYKMYGKEIYTPEQVEKISNTQIGYLTVKYSQTGLADNWFIIQALKE